MKVALVCLWVQPLLGVIAPTVPRWNSLRVYLPRRIASARRRLWQVHIPTMKFYAIRNGRDGFTGIVDSWGECQALVLRVPNVQYKSFGERREAEAFLEPGVSRGRSMGEVKSEAVWVIYTDGACEGNGKDVAWAGVGVYFGPNDPRNISEPLEGPQQTNNRAEMTAVIRALEAVLREAGSSEMRAVEIRTDSEYTKNGIESWLNGWKRRGWRLASGGEVKNRDLWERLDGLRTQVEAQRELQFVWVRGHCGEVGNEMADQLAVDGARSRMRH